MRIRLLMGTAAVGVMLAAAPHTVLAQQAQSTSPTLQQSAPSGTTGSSSGAPATIKSAKWYDGKRAGDLIGKDVSNQAGEIVGEIGKIVVDSDDEPYAVMSVGGFLGIGAKDVMIPLTSMEMRGDHVRLLSAEDEASLEGLPTYEETHSDYREVAEDETLGN